MKKLLLTAAIAVFGVVGMKAQSTGFEAGAYVGIPMGDVKDATSINFGISGAYYWDLAAGFQLGVKTGYDHWTAKEQTYTFMEETIKVKGDDAGFIPIAASAKYLFSPSFFGGMDLGYAIYVGSGDGDGGFLYQPRLGYSHASFDAYGFYKGISVDGGTFSSIGVGFAYKF